MLDDSIRAGFELELVEMLAPQWVTGEDTTFMTQPSKPQIVRPIAATGGRLVRSRLLTSSVCALQSARDLETRASQCPANDTSVMCIERVSAHREILARRAANVALSSATTADELGELREATRRLIAVHGWAARKLGLGSRMN